MTLREGGVPSQIEVLRTLKGRKLVVTEGEKTTVGTLNDNGDGSLEIEPDDAIQDIVHITSNNVGRMVFRLPKKSH